MGMIRCARCGRPEDEASASVGEQGLICQWCLAGVKAQDAAQAAVGDRHDAMLGSGIGRLLEAVGSARTDELMAAMQPGSFPALPVSADGAHAALQARGARLERSAQREQVTLFGATRASEGYTERWFLPSRPRVQASFVHEGLWQELKGVFTRELQTGEDGFDMAVFITTTTPDETRALLARREARDAIYTAVTHGGHVTIDGNVLEGNVLWPIDDRGPRPQELFAQLGLLLLDR